MTDRHAPSIEHLRVTIAERGLSQPAHALVGDMARPDQTPESFDLIWSGGELYYIGISNALQTCHRLLRSFVDVHFGGNKFEVKNG